jgi:hypothetical protein
MLPFGDHLITVSDNNNIIIFDVADQSTDSVTSALRCLHPMIIRDDL